MSLDKPFSDLRKANKKKQTCAQKKTIDYTINQNLTNNQAFEAQTTKRLKQMTLVKKRSQKSASRKTAEDYGPQTDSDLVIK